MEGESKGLEIKGRTGMEVTRSRTHIPEDPGTISFTLGSWSWWWTVEQSIRRKSGGHITRTQSRSEVVLEVH